MDCLAPARPALPAAERDPSPVSHSKDGSPERVLELPPSSRDPGRMLPLAVTDLPEALLAYRIGDCLEFHERMNLAAVSRQLNRAMGLGTDNPLYRALLAARATLARLLKETADADAMWDVQPARQAFEAARSAVDDDRRLRAAALQFERARNDWARLLQARFEADPGSAIHAGDAARLLGQLGRTTEALELLDWARRRMPASQAIQVQWAEMQLQLEEPGPVIESGVPAVHPQARVLMARARLLRSQARSREDQAAGAREDLQGAVQVLGASGSVEETLTRAMLAHSLGQPAQADAAVKLHCRQRGTRIDPRLAEVHAWRGEPEHALDCIRGAMKANMQDPRLCLVVHSPFMASVRDDDRWHALLQRMNRSPAQLAAVSFHVAPPP